jgi:hypothetical protein
LVTPSLLLLILMIQLSQMKESYSNFYFTIGFLFCNLLINFAVTFYIYYIYGIHRLQKEKYLTYTNVKLYGSYIYKYISNDTSVRIVILYYFGQIIAVIMCFNWISDPHLVKKYEGLIIFDFTKFAIICNALFIFGNTILYSYLFLALMCKVNFSCICKILSNYCSTTTNNDAVKHENEVPEHEAFIVKSMRFFKFLGIYDIEKQFPKKEENVVKLENE